MNRFLNCWPVIIYTVLSVIQIVVALFTNKDHLREKTGVDSKAGYIVGQIVGTLVGYAVLFTLCHHGYFKTAWVVLLLPVIFVVVSLFLLVSVARNASREGFGAAAGDDWKREKAMREYIKNEGWAG